MREADLPEASMTFEATTAWTDGSARKGTDSVCRRAGWGVRFSSGDERLGPLKSESQTVYRAELRAMVEAIEATTGSIRVVTDCKSVWEGFVAGKAHGDQDLWKRIFEGRRGRTITCEWMRAHQSEQEARVLGIKKATGKAMIGLTRWRSRE